jgi:DNA repair exonuclease SbcCD ATPase subunit
LSFGSGTGRARSGTKGFSNKEKKQKRKKQEFHTHRRAHFQESERPDPEEVRARTILALDRLGHQVLSSEPGGYDLEDWTRSLNSLLDDFQEKVEAGLVTEEFRARRQEVLKGLAPSSSARDVDSEIERLTKEEEAARAAVDEAEKKATARLASLREERDACAKELKAERERLAELKEANQSRQFFSRILRAGPSTGRAEESVSQLESKLKGLEDEIETSRKARSAARGGARGEGDPAYVEAQQRLEAAREKLLDLQSSRQSLLQLAREREAATQALSSMISTMKLDGAASGGGGTVER